MHSSDQILKSVTIYIYIVLLCLWGRWRNFIGKIGVYRVAWAVDVQETSQCKLSGETVSLNVTCHHTGVGGGAVLNQVGKGITVVSLVLGIDDDSFSIPINLTSIQPLQRAFLVNPWTQRQIGPLVIRHFLLIFDLVTEFTCTRAEQLMGHHSDWTKSSTFIGESKSMTLFL